MTPDELDAEVMAVMEAVKLPPLPSRRRGLRVEPASWRLAPPA